MLKSLRKIEFITRCKKSGVEVGTNESDDGGDDSDYDDKHSPYGLGQTYQQTHQLPQPRLRSSTMRLMVLMANRSKSCQKVVKKLKNHQRFQKLQTFAKIAKAIILEKHLLKHQFFVKKNSSFC